MEHRHMFLMNIQQNIFAGKKNFESVPFSMDCLLTNLIVTSRNNILKTFFQQCLFFDAKKYFVVKKFTFNS